MRNQQNTKKSFNLSENLSEIPLNRIQKHEAVCYVSAIAFKLASFWQQPAQEIAAQLVILLCQEQASLSPFFEDLGGENGGDRRDQLNPQTLSLIWQNFNIYALPPGWIYLELNPIGLAAWLQLLVNQAGQWNCSPLIEVSSALSNNRNSTRIFEVVYTYARCAALMRLGSQANLVQLTSPPSALVLAECIANPQPLPWLAAETMQWNPESIDAEFLAQIIDGWDVLGTDALSWEHRWKATYRLSQQFQTFYSSCQIFGEVAITTPALAQTRLGFVFITQRLLHHLVSTALPLTIEL